MSTSEADIHLIVRLHAADMEDVEDLNRQLREDMRQLENATVYLAEADTPMVGTKSGTLSIDWTTLLVALAASGGVLTTLVNIILSKLTRDRSVTLEIDGDKLEVTGISSEEQQHLINLWIKRNRKEGKKHV